MPGRSELDYETFLEIQRRKYGDRSYLMETLGVRNAQEEHAWVIFSALQSEMLRGTHLAPQLKTEQGRFYLLHGACRRLKMMWSCYRSIIFRARPERKGASERGRAGRDEQGYKSDLFARSRDA